jgi:hypothetical protein
MSADPPKNTTMIWDGIIKYAEPAPDAQTEAIREDIEARLDGFDSHQEQLLLHLRKAYERDGSKSEPFDEHKLWRRISIIFYQYCWRERVKRERISADDRAARLHKLAKVLGKARGMVDDAMQDDVGDDLFTAWAEEADESLMPAAEFKALVAGVATLEAAALRAAKEVHEERTGPGRPQVLSRGTILALARLYRTGTGTDPGAGDGPFARFVFDFFTALDRRHFTYNSVIDAIKDVRPYWV